MGTEYEDIKTPEQIEIEENAKRKQQELLDEAEAEEQRELKAQKSQEDIQAEVVVSLASVRVKHKGCLLLPLFFRFTKIPRIG